MTTKRRTKKAYNPLKFKTLRVEQVAEDFLIVFTGGGLKVKVIEIKSGLLIEPVPVALVDMFITQKFCWCISLCVMLRDHFGKEYYDHAQYVMPYPVTQTSISDSLQQRHAELVKANNANHVVNLGWVASIRDNVTTDTVESLMHQLDAWDYLAKWEVQHDQQATKN